MAGPAKVWRHRTGEIVLDRTRVMGVLNVTPDSFSDAGVHYEYDAAVRRGLEIADQGADLIDIGGESTRPGSDSVSAEEEWRRVGRVIETLARKVDVPLSIDTMKIEVAGKAVDAGASVVNDVSGMRDPAFIRLIASRQVGVVAMHMLGNPKTMQQNPQYADVVGEVRGFLAARIGALEAAGVPADAIAVDPGIGFGKSMDHNLALLLASPISPPWGIPWLSASRASPSSGSWERASRGSAFPGAWPPRPSRLPVEPKWSGPTTSSRPSARCGSRMPSSRVGDLARQTFNLGVTFGR